MRAALPAELSCVGGLRINGSGTFVYHIENSTYFFSAGTVNMEINGPSGVITQTGNARAPARR